MHAWLETTGGIQVPLHGVCSIGRSSRNSIVINDPLVSRRHAMIHSQGEGEHWLVDLGSSNGVLLNGRRVKQPVKLKDHDRIEVAAERLVYRRSTASSPEPATDQTAFMPNKRIEKSNLWILVGDLEQSADEDEKPSLDEFAQLVGGWFLSCKEILEKHQARIHTYSGNGFLAYWPDPQVAPPTVAQALADLKHKQQARAEPFRIALHYGSVSIDKGNTQDEDRLLGNEVTFVYRAEKLAASLKQTFILSEPAASRLAEFGRLQPLGKHAVAGCQESHQFFTY